MFSMISFLFIFVNTNFLFVSKSFPYTPCNFQSNFRILVMVPVKLWLRQESSFPTGSGLLPVKNEEKEMHENEEQQQHQHS